MPSISRQETKDWELFADWCESMDRSPLPSTADTVGEFLAACPAAISTQGRRLRSIRRHHAAAGYQLDLPGTTISSPWREGDEWAPLPQALAQLPVYRHQKGLPVALRGRRDGWLLVLLGVVGLTRNDARMLPDDAVSLFPRLSIARHPIPREEPPAECPACAATRWLRVAGSASFGWRHSIAEEISPAGDPLGHHDCTIGLDGTWRQASTLLPSIDRHGWVSADPMTPRAVSATVALRLSPGARDALEQSTVRPSVGRFSKATMDELADAYDDLDERAAALLLRLKEIVGETDEMLGQIKSLSS